MYVAKQIIDCFHEALGVSAPVKAFVVAVDPGHATAMPEALAKFEKYAKQLTEHLTHLNERFLDAPRDGLCCYLGK